MWIINSSWGTRRWQRLLTALLVSIVFAPQSSVDATVGLDPSWQAVPPLAAAQHIPWGSRLVFTYGPLAYLQTTAYYVLDQSLIATAYQFAVVAALVLGIAAVLRQRRPPLVSLIGAAGATALAVLFQVGHGSAEGIMYPEIATLAALAWLSLLLLEPNPKRSASLAICGVTGAVAGFELLVKFNTGLTLLTITLATSIALGWKSLDRHVVVLLAFAVTSFACWVATGQLVSELRPWLFYSEAIFFGYQEAQAVPLEVIPGPAILLSIGWVTALTYWFVRPRTALPRKYLAIIGLFSAIAIKTAFGRFDIWHFSMLLGLIVVVVTLIPAAGIHYRALWIAAMVLVFTTVGGVPVLTYRTATALTAPPEGLERIVTLTFPGLLVRRVEDARARQRESYRVPREFLDEIGSRTVHVDPDETSVVWAYNLAWHPAPVFATYSAYTPTLDKLNADTLVNGPDFVLSRISAASPAVGIDGRLGTQESPLYSRALLCNYELRGVMSDWALYARLTSSRCGPLIELSTVEIGTRRNIPVPTPSGRDKAILAGIDLEPNLRDQLLQGTIAPLQAFTVLVDGNRYRLIASNAAEPFLISTPKSKAKTNLTINARTIGVGRTYSPILPSDDYVQGRLRFYEMSVETPNPS